MRDFDDLIYYRGELSPGSVIELSREESKHLHVLRKKKDTARIFLTNGEGILARAKLIPGKSTTATLEITETELYQKPSPVDIFLAAAVLKGNRYDWLLEKSTELGISAFIPLHTERVIKGKKEKEDRWENKILAAMKQSKQLYKPELFPLTDFFDIKASFPDIHWICFHEKSETIFSPLTFTPGNNKIGILIGPEGGFTEKESAYFDSYRLPGVQRLRAETAAVTAINLVQACYLWNN